MKASSLFKKKEKSDKSPGVDRQMPRDLVIGEAVEHTQRREDGLWRELRPGF